MTMARSYHLHERLVFMLRFVKAQFPNSQKHYDYICDLDDIQKGDLVFVMTQYGKKLVTVRASRPEDNKLAEERRRLQHDESGLRIVLLLLPAVVFIYLLYRFVFV